MTYFRRATVFLAMGKSKSALPDLTKVIELKPDFTAVSYQEYQSHYIHLISLIVHYMILFENICKDIIK